MTALDIGVLGLGVMGKNLALNLDEKGLGVAVHDAWPEQVEKVRAELAETRIQAFADRAEFVRSLARPRRIVLLVKAGQVVDDTLAALVPLLEREDLVVDAGNEHFPETERRAAELAAKGLRYFGMGVSGGEEGARHGPSLMPGGDRSAYDHLAPVLAKIAAQAPDGPCVAYVGPGGAGHYVKMVHNGIEYGDMQLIAEAYAVLQDLGGLAPAALADAFDRYNQGELESYLVEITARIFRRSDPETGQALLDVIEDSASMKGTGSWTVQDAAAIGVAVPTIASAVDARVISSRRALRQAASKALRGPVPQPGPDLIRQVGEALYAAKCCSYAQGFDLIRAASDLRGWGIRLSELARIWKAGCIIRARLLGDIQAALSAEPPVDHLLLAPAFAEVLAARQASLRLVVARAVEAGISVPGLASSLAYFDALRAPRLPANLIQAQRDYFGAHTYRRTDREGSFHTRWGEPDKTV
jgi:6-phosphogluconate dehydrogenase